MRRWSDIIKVDLKEMCCEDVDCICVLRIGSLSVAETCEHVNQFWV